MATRMRVHQLRDFGAGDSGLSQTTLTVIIVFLSISLYNVLELVCIIFGTFKRYSGLYFWSFLVATFGIASSCTGFFIKYFASPPPGSAVGYVSATLSLGGWVCMVTGQSMVLWSRLHLVLQEQRRLKLVLGMIITNAILLHGTTIPLVYGSFSDNPDIFHKPYVVMERIEITAFFLQELLLSSLYIIETVKLMKLERYMGNVRLSRRLMKHLILVNIVIIILDASILALEYANQYDYQISYKSFVYSVKLKMEFTILNRLVEMTTARKDASFSLQSEDSNTIAKTGIALEAYIGEGRSKPTRSASYQAYARGGGESSHSRVRRNGDEVAITTEVIVKHDGGQDCETGSICRVTSADLVIEEAKEPGTESVSKFPSEIHECRSL